MSNIPDQAYDDALEELRVKDAELARLRITDGYWGAVWANMEHLRPFFFHRTVVLKPDGSFDGGAMVIAEIKAMAAKIEALQKSGQALADEFTPGPIPAESPTRMDYLLADWEEATSKP